MRGLAGMAAAGLGWLILAGCTDRVAGGGSETEYFTLTGEGELGSGAPAAGAKVTVRPAGYLSGEIPRSDGSVRDTVLDDSGTFRLTGLPDGEYIVEIRLGDSAAFAATVAKSPSLTATVSGTLAPMGRLRSGIAGPDSGVAYLLRIRGLERVAAAGPSGNLGVSLPAGTWTAEFSASLPGTRILRYSEIRIRPGADTVIAPLPAAAFYPGPAAPVPVIYDANTGIAADDAGGLAVLHALADLGEARILATGTSQASRLSAAVLDAINTWYGRPAIPVGTWKRQVPAPKSDYDSLIAADFPQDLPAWDSLSTAAQVYRDALADQPDSQAVIVVSGGVHNAWELMRLDRDLVARKVREIVIMGGQYPAGSEHNFTVSVGIPGLPNLPAELVRDWPGPITFHGHEISSAITTGSCLAGAPLMSPVRRIYEWMTGSADRGSVTSDLSPVLYGVRGLGTLWDKVTTGSNTVNADGTNQWMSTPDSNQAYLVLKAPPASLRDEVDALLCRPPGLDGP